MPAVMTMLGGNMTELLRDTQHTCIHCGATYPDNPLVEDDECFDCRKERQEYESSDDTDH